MAALLDAPVLNVAPPTGYQSPFASGEGPMLTWERGQEQVRNAALRINRVRALAALLLVDCQSKSARSQPAKESISKLKRANRKLSTRCSALESSSRRLQDEETDACSRLLELGRSLSGEVLSISVRAIELLSAPEIDSQQLATLDRCMAALEDIEIAKAAVPAEDQYLARRLEAMQSERTLLKRRMAELKAAQAASEDRLSSLQRRITSVVGLLDRARQTRGHAKELGKHEDLTPVAEPISNDNGPVSGFTMRFASETWACEEPAEDSQESCLAEATAKQMAPVAATTTMTLTVPQLLARLTDPKTDPEVQRCLLMTHRSFVDSRSLFLLLIMRFCLIPSFGQESRAFRASVQQPSQVLVLVVFKQWLTRFPSDFGPSRDSPSLGALAMHFLQSCRCASDHATIVDRLVVALRPLLSNTPARPSFPHSDSIDRELSWAVVAPSPASRSSSLCSSDGRSSKSPSQSSSHSHERSKSPILSSKGEKKRSKSPSLSSKGEHRSKSPSLGSSWRSKSPSFSSNLDRRASEIRRRSKSPPRPSPTSIDDQRGPSPMVSFKLEQPSPLLFSAAPERHWSSPTFLAKLSPRSLSPRDTIETEPPAGMASLPKLVNLCMFVVGSAGASAQQLCLDMFDVYCTIQPREFLPTKASGSGSSKEETAPNLAKMSALFNTTGAAVMGSILQARSEEVRAQRIEYFIEMAQECIDLHNFHGCLSITSALTTSPIHRLKRSWALVKPQSVQKLEQLSPATLTADNSQALRMKMQRIGLRCVPYIGMYLTELAYLLETPTYVGGLINTQKFLLIGRRITDCLRFKSNQYPFEPNPSITAWFASPENQITLEDAQARSLLLEPMHVVASQQ
ncbi:MAG: RasGEF domain-containing protein [archaeon]|nr:RasGEF domain-containing protein [archaeon]